MPTTTLPAPLVRLVNAIHPQGEEVWRALTPALVRRRLAAREHYAVPGAVQTSVGLLESGRVRAYYVTPGGKPYNKHFFTGPDVIGDYASLLTGRPVEVPQQALTPCVVWSLDHAWLVSLEDRFPSLVQLQRRFAEALYLAKEQRELDLATRTAGERYAALTARHPGIEAEIPLYEIAAYLGVTPTQLSRIRSRARREQGA
ncbi:MAG: Crp/Fnr family transcriptional regulator [Sandaracinaceae bacterium]|nr:Crp/Fnr family transcriptional regulator [Sandaracinaceae bacterium]